MVWLGMVSHGEVRCGRVGGCGRSGVSALALEEGKKMDERLLWLHMESLSRGVFSRMTITTAEAQLIMREIAALQRIVREMGTGEALLVHDVRESLGMRGAYGINL